MPACGGGGGVAAWRGEGGDGDRPSGAGEQAGGDVAVAAIVAGTAEDQHRAGTEAGADGLGHGPAGAFHQHVDRGAGCHRVGVGLGHLGGGQQVFHGGSLVGDCV